MARIGGWRRHNKETWLNVDGRKITLWVDEDVDQTGKWMIVIDTPKGQQYHYTPTKKQAEQVAINFMRRNP